MNLFASWKRAGFALVLAAGLGLACSSDPATEPDDRICAPGTNVVCKCQNLQTGTKLCNDEGSGYSTPCSVGGSEECPGGELPEPGSSSSGRPSSSSSGSSPESPDACPGQLVAVPPGAPIELTNGTDGAADDAKGSAACAAGGGAPDHVYRIVPSARGDLKIEITSSTAGYAPIVYLRRGDCAAGAQVACAAAGAGQGADFTSKVVAGESYWLVVDGAAGPNGTGDYKVTATLTERAFCGDTIADQDEVCDDGNDVDGDGCSADCTNFDGNPPSALQCPGQPVHLWVDTPGDPRGTGSTNPTKLIGVQNTFDSVPSGCSALGGPGAQPDGGDHVYQLIAHGSGQLYVSILSPTFYAKATTWTVCNSADPASNLDLCAQTVSADPASFDLPIVSLADGQQYTLVVDGNNGESGDFEVQMLFVK